MITLVNRHIYAGGYRPLPRYPRKACPTCGGKTMRQAYFDSEQVYLTAVCITDAKHPEMEYPWPPGIQQLNTEQAAQMGFAVIQ
jgi:hypothetical protein